MGKGCYIRYRAYSRRLIISDSLPTSEWTLSYGLMHGQHTHSNAVARPHYPLLFETDRALDEPWSLGEAALRPASTERRGRGVARLRSPSSSAARSPTPRARYGSLRLRPGAGAPGRAGEHRTDPLFPGRAGRRTDPRRDDAPGPGSDAGAWRRVAAQEGSVWLDSARWRATCYRPPACNSRSPARTPRPTHRPRRRR